MVKSHRRHATIPSRTQQQRGWWFVVLAVVVCCATEVGFAAEGAIYFGNRQFVGGNFASGSDQHGFLWSNPWFTDPFLFRPETIREISFPQREDSIAEPGEFGIELTNGDVVFGSLVESDPQQIVVRSEMLGDLPLKASFVRRIFRWDGGSAQIFVGPGQLESWRTGDRASGWEGQSGHLATDQSLASVFRDVGLTPRCRVEFEVTWDQTPNFVMAIGTDGTPQATDAAFRIEFWGSAIVLLREIENKAKVSSLGNVEDADGRFRLAIELDQIRSRAIVYSERGLKLGEIDFDRDQGDVYGGIAIENISGDVRLHELRVLHGVGRDSPAGQRSELIGSVLSGYSDGNLEFRRDDQPQSIPSDQIDVIRFEGAGDDESVVSEGIENQPSDVAPRFHVVTHGSTQISGAVHSVDAETLVIRPSVAEDKTIRISVEQIRSMRALFEPETIMLPDSQRVGTLELENAGFMGSLEDASRGDDSTCLRFKPQYSSTAANLKPGASGRIAYRYQADSKQNSSAQPPQPPQPPRRARGGFLGAVVTALAGDTESNGSTGRLLHLRSGDAVEATVLRIDAESVVIDSIITGEKSIPRSEVKAVELRGPPTLPNIEQVKRSRLLTVPRMRKSNPPTHLLISTEGDFLKCNLISLNDSEAVVENRLETLVIPRRLIARIIWFHEDELASEDAAVQDAAEPDSSSIATESDRSGSDEFLVQAIFSDGVRLTFKPGQVGAGELVGESEILGTCLVNVKVIDQLLFGDRIATQNAKLPYNEWHLSHAPEPRVYQENAEGSGQPRMIGTSSSLVGNPAPEFDLKLLDGGKFNPVDGRGQVIVLDFWATWCGPCIQAMPIIDQTVNQFASEDVKLVAVNLQEPADKIRDTLDRMNLHPTVALDIDGVAASRYQANAIPQTVVIDRQGIVRRVFVGGGGDLAQSLTDAIQSAVDNKPDSAVESAEQ
jgi:thiol-disulfide isomerase/thioredoxin